MNLRLSPYQPGDAGAWNALVAASPNATFLFDRRYMDYHADRFEDASLTVWRDERLIALLPAHRDGERLASHAGLSYGGLVWAEVPGAELALQVVQALQARLADQGVPELLYKSVPAIYHQRPCEADGHALWRCGARVVRSDALFVIGPGPRQWPPEARRHIRRVKRQTPGLQLQAEAGGDADWAAFWSLLAQVLDSRHGTRPVHTLAEMRLLAGRFPQQIRLALARQDGTVCAGAVCYESAAAVHLQYMAADERARQSLALHQLLELEILRARAAGRWLDLGHCGEDGGRRLNTSLAAFKESLGASVLVQEHFVLPCAAAGMP